MPKRLRYCARLLLAQTYLAKPIRLIVPYPAGGGADIVARMVGNRLTESWGQPVLVENQVGASGIVGNDLVAKSAPDGYTVLFGITTLVQGLKDFEASGWFAMFLPANAPRDIVAKLAAEVTRIRKLPDVAARISDTGHQPGDASLDTFAAVVKADYTVWGRVVRDAQIRLEQ